MHSLKLLFITALFIFGAVAHAQIQVKETGVYAGALVGANLPSGNFGTSVSPIYGLTLGAKLSPLFGIGILGTYNGQRSTGNFLGISTGSQTSRIVLAGEGNIYYSIAHLGFDLGVEINSSSANVGSVSTGTSSTGLIFGPKIGIDVPVGSVFSIGAQGHYFFTSLENSQGNWVFAGNIKFWQ